MFFFNRLKPRLKDLIPDRYFDIHSHLLFGIDDGSKSFEETLLLLKNLEKIGFSGFITTPHIIKSVWDNTPESINNKYAETKNLLKSHGTDFKIKPAAEYMMDSFFFEKIKSEPLLTIKDNYVLVEMSYFNPPIHLYDIIFEIQIQGYTPVLAHPERYLFYFKNLDEYKKLKKSGCLFQINLLSTTGYYGKEATITADFLLKKGMIDFTGSDVHNMKHVESFEKRIIVKEKASLKEAFERNSIFSF